VLDAEKRIYGADVYVGQIAFALRQTESGTPVGEVCRKLGVSE
jgi:hypothetical protein